MKGGRYFGMGGGSKYSLRCIVSLHRKTSSDFAVLVNLGKLIPPLWGQSRQASWLGEATAWGGESRPLPGGVLGFEDWRRGGASRLDAGRRGDSRRKELSRGVTRAHLGRPSTGTWRRSASAGGVCMRAECPETLDAQRRAGGG